MIKEQQLREMEASLKSAADQARRAGISFEALDEMLRMIYFDEES